MGATNAPTPSPIAAPLIPCRRIEMVTEMVRNAIGVLYVRGSERLSWHIYGVGVSGSRHVRPGSRQVRIRQQL